MLFIPLLALLRPLPLGIGNFTGFAYVQRPAFLAHFSYHSTAPPLSVYVPEVKTSVIGLVLLCDSNRYNTPAYLRVAGRELWFPCHTERIRRGTSGAESQSHQSYHSHSAVPSLPAGMRDIALAH